MKKGTRKPDFGYDFWYQPFFNVMISTEYGAPKFFMENLNLEHVSGGGYGTHLNVFDWKERTLKQRIDLGAEGVMPLEIRGAIQYSLEKHPEKYHKLVMIFVTLFQDVFRTDLYCMLSLLNWKCLDSTGVWRREFFTELS